MPEPEATHQFEPPFTPPPTEAWNTLAPPPSAGSAVEGTNRGRYTIVKEHAQGGLGKVSLARDAKLHRTVALKEIRPDRRLDEAVRQRFLNEAAITGQLEHPGVVPIYALEEDETGRPYYAMRFIQGRTLTQAIADCHARPTPLGLRGLLQRFVSVCQTMAYAHNKGVIHRDLKPDNIMLGDYGETLVVDWGLAKQMAGWRGGEVAIETPESKSSPAHDPTTSPPHDLTQEGQIMGTPAYMAPEQARGDQAAVGPAADIHALGAILHTVVTGQPPRTGNIFEVLDRLRSGEAPPSAALGGTGVPRPLAAVCQRAMAPRAEDRYPSALALAQEVECWLADEPVGAYREPWWLRCRRWMRRHRTLTTGVMAAICVLAVMLGLLAGVMQAGRKRESQLRENAEQARDRARQTLEQMTSEQALLFLRRQVALVPEQREFLQKALAYYQELTAEAASTPEERARQALAFYRMSLLQELFGRREDALAACDSALALYAPLAAEFPAVPAHGETLGKCHLQRGGVLSELGRHDAAEQAFRHATNLHAGLAARFPAEPGHRRQHTLALSQLGHLLAKVGRWAEAEQAYLTVLRMQQQLAATQPDNQEHRRALADSHFNVSLVLLSQGRRLEAEKPCQQALDEYTKLAATAPADPLLRRNLANANLAMGLLDSQAGRREPAVLKYRTAIEHYERLAGEFPTVFQYRRELASSHGSLGALLGTLGRLPESETHRRRALALDTALANEFPDMPDHRDAQANRQRALASLLARMGRRQEAEATYREALAIHEGLARAFPTVPAYGEHAADAQESLGCLLFDMKRPQEGEAALGTVLARRRAMAEAYAGIPSYREEVAKSLCALSTHLFLYRRHQEMLKHLTEAESIMAALVKADPEKPLFHRQLGIVFTLRARALAALGRLPEAADATACAAKAFGTAMSKDPKATASFMEHQWQRFLEFELAPKTLQPGAGDTSPRAPE
jgi:eukaryotic-like serine/threonine-protein kinase